MNKAGASAVAFAALMFLSRCVISPVQGAAVQPSLPGLSIYNITSAWTTQDGKTVRLDSLRGRPVIVAMIYLSCPDVCPLIAENMQRIGAHLPKELSSKVGFVLFSFDPDRDSPEKLQAYATARGLDPHHWALLRSDEMATRELAAALDLTYRRTEDGNFDHSVVISLLGANGVVVFRQIGLKEDTKEFISKIEALEHGRFQ